MSRFEPRVHVKNFLAIDLIRHTKWTGKERVKVENGVDAVLLVDLAGMPTSQAPF
jgi:hypothetical protein